MYSYQHRYHSGNFADLHKHLVLIAILEAVQNKETPFCVLNAFAGEGIYDLNSKESQKNKEYLSGFGKVRKALVVPYLVQELLRIAKIYQIEDQTFMYPGSPAIIQTKLREQDRAIFIEDHPQAHFQLNKYFRRNTQVNIHKRDGIEAINALVPFKQKRGLIFIDPSYEIKDEYNIICEVIEKAVVKFAHGIYMLWYPLLQGNKHFQLLKRLQRSFTNVWQHEWKPIENAIDGMYGSGILIINPPWQLNKIMQESLEFLQQL